MTNGLGGGGIVRMMAGCKQAMPALTRHRLLQIVVALVFLLATAIPASAAFQAQAARTHCGDYPIAAGDMPDCSGRVTKAVFCGFSAWTGQAVEASGRLVPAEQVALPVTFPFARLPQMTGETPVPDPFPPRPRRLA